jgi:hypothetical protein
MKNFYALLSILAVPATLLLVSYHTGSPGGRTGSPGDGGTTCTSCHTGTATTVSGWITTNIPSQGYTPGQTYLVTATGTHTGVVYFGFELTAENSGGANVGTFSLTEPGRTKLVSGNTSVTHTDGGINPIGNTNTWTMNWTAPVSGTGQVGFYAAFNAANGNGNTSGDVIYKTSLMVNEFIPPALVSIVPNNADQGESFTATILGSNTTFTGSEDVSLDNNGNPLETIVATSVVRISNTWLEASFDIPGDAWVGIYDVNVDALVLPNSFTVIEVLPSIQFMEPNIGYPGDDILADVFGTNTQWTEGVTEVYLTYGNDPGQVIDATSFTVFSDTQLEMQFTIPAEASMGNYDLHVDALVKEDAFTVLSLPQAITSMDPNSAEQGVTVVSVITGQNTDWTIDEPVVVLSYQEDPGEAIIPSLVTVVSDTELEATFDIAYNAMPGLYDLHVDNLDLNGAFSVIEVVPFFVGLTPETAFQGETFTMTISTGNTFFTFEAPSVSMSNSSNPGESIDALSTVVIDNTTVEATFAIPLSATVGQWDVHVDDLVAGGIFEVLLFVGVDEGSNAPTVKLFPNPASGRVTLANAMGMRAKVMNTRGETIADFMVRGQQVPLDLSAYPSGIYILNVTDGARTSSHKILMKK